MIDKFDTLVVITPKNSLRLRSNYSRLVKWLPDGQITFVGSDKVGELVVELSESIRSGIQLSAGEEIPEDRLGFINEKNHTYIHRLEEILKM